MNNFISAFESDIALKFHSNRNITGLKKRLVAA